MATIKRVISIISVFSILLIAGSVLAGVGGPEPTSPKAGGPGGPPVPIQNWTSVLKSHADWLKNKPEGSGDYSINIALVYNNQDGEAGYAEGGLRLVTVTQGKPPHQALLGTFLQGEVTLYKNTERWGEFDPEDPEAIDPGVGGKYPFDPNQTEQVEVKIDVKTGQVDIGASTITKPEYSKGVAFGFEKKLSKPKYYVISLNRQFVPPLR
ncbi:MAG: hypothetical protein AB1797_04860 [bacterium]